ncbi:CvpA family protein [uncultured Paludibaculum sp.]|uniref:CvpA family protein n=1 Tax=uncultured Paludibaculum sp. TaxID=1765020 RepID=UPI002AAAEAE2|nr:CvpA family protein [uncultured Paludibaculum sp.]
MNWLDIFFLVILGIFVAQGIRRGFTRLAIGLAATLLGLLLASWFYGSVGAYFEPYLSSRALCNIVGFLLVFVGVQAAGGLLGWGLSRLFKWTGLGLLDRLLGALFGFIKATLIGIVLVMMLLAFPIKPIPASVAESSIAPYLIEASHVVVYLAPRELKDGFLASYERVKKLWNGTRPDAEPKSPPRSSS